MTPIHVLDLRFLGTDESIASFLLETSDGPVLIESGPETTWSELVREIRSVGYEPNEIRHVFLTHIHFDHAGAAWKLAQLGAKVYVHPIGLPHLAAPEKLWNSAAQIYGADMERLWGTMEAIPMSQLVAVDEGDVIQIGDTQITTWYTPGHAVHHNAYQVENALFTGDVAGAKIERGPIQPPCPPPDINIELWLSSIEKLRHLDVQRLYLTHFSLHENPAAHFDELRDRLLAWTAWIKPYFDADTPIESVTPLFVAFTQNELREAGLSDQELTRYEYANPSFMSVTGLYRYWKLKSQGRI